MCDDITYQLQNLNSYKVEVWEWVINFITYITYTLLVHAAIHVKLC